MDATTRNSNKAIINKYKQLVVANYKMVCLTTAPCKDVLQELQQGQHDGNLRTREKFRKHEPRASVFYISQVFSNNRSGVFYDSIIHGFGFFMCFLKRFRRAKR